jgi:hypothetical protein
MSEYPGFDKAREDWKADPNCRACGRPTETINSFTGVTCRECTIIWYDPPAEISDEDRCKPDVIGAYCLKAEREGLYPFRSADQS